MTMPAGLDARFDVGLDVKLDLQLDAQLDALAYPVGMVGPGWTLAYERREVAHEDVDSAFTDGYQWTVRDPAGRLLSEWPSQWCDTAELHALSEAAKRAAELAGEPFDRPRRITYPDPSAGAYDHIHAQQTPWTAPVAPALPRARPARPGDYPGGMSLILGKTVRNSVTTTYGTALGTAWSWSATYTLSWQHRAARKPLPARWAPVESVGLRLERQGVTEAAALWSRDLETAPGLYSLQLALIRCNQAHLVRAALSAMKLPSWKLEASWLWDGGPRPCTVSELKAAVRS